MKYLSVGILLCLLNGFAVAQAGQDVHFDLHIPYDTVGMNEQLQLQFTLSNAEIDHINLPSIPGFESLHQPSRSQSVSIVNGYRSSKVVYTYRLQPTAVGTFYIPSISVETSAGVFETTEMPITVVRQMQPRQDPLLSQSPFGSFGFPHGQDRLTPPSFDRFFEQGFPEMPNFDQNMKDFWKQFEKQMPRRPSTNPQDNKKQYRL